MGSHRAIMLGLLGLAATAARPDEVAVANQALRLAFDSADGYSLSSARHLGHDVNWLAPRSQGADQDRSPWVIHLADSTRRRFRLSARDATTAHHELTGETLELTWEGVGNEACPADLTVTVTVRLEAPTGPSRWRIAVTGNAPAELWQVDFPRICGIRSVGDDQMASPHYLGRLTRQPAAQPVRWVLAYPEPASMQWLAVWGTPDRREPELPTVERGAVESGWSPDRSDATGLYLAAEDSELWYKRFGCDGAEVKGQLVWWVESVPNLTTWPIREGAHRIDYHLPYDVVVSAFTGDLTDAAGIYRAWASRQVWCGRGTADTWPEQQPTGDDLSRWVPPWFREVGFWAKFYLEPAKVLPEWAAYRQWLRVPMASHWYRYNIARFDDNYPEHLPPDPYFLQGIRDAKELGVRPLPYINGVIWDTDTQSWIREHGLAAAAKNEEGATYHWPIGGEDFAYMCPGAEQWRAKMRETAGKLILDHGCSGVYLDCLTATTPQLCYDLSHGHGVHGGTQYAQGSRTLMHDLRAYVRQEQPDAGFFTEEIGEHLVDLMDGYLTLDQMRSWPSAGQQVYPVFTAVYHPYAINFGCDAALGQAADFYRWEMGQMLVWGAVPLNSAVIAPAPKEGDADSEFLREVVQAYYVAGKPFLCGGQWERLAVRPKGAPEGHGGLELAADPYQLTYELRRDVQRTWAGPAVMASAWSRGGDLGVVMVNVTDREQRVELTVRPEALKLAADARLVRTWPREPEVLGAAAGTHRLAVPAGRVAICLITTDPTDRIDPSDSATLDQPAWDLVTTVDGDLPAAEGPAGSLFANDDGPVANEVAAAKTVATVQRLEQDGTLVRRAGHQAEAHGTAADSRALPRRSADQPFALFRRLPHRIETDGAVTVWSGDAHQLCCAAPGGSRFTFATPGLVVATAPDGEVVHAVSAAPTATLVLPGGGPFWVGYAVLDAGTLRDRSDASLAAATQAAVEAIARCRETPERLVPGGPLVDRMARLRSLAAARAGTWQQLVAEDDWVTPGVAKEVRLWSAAGAVAPGRPHITPLAPADGESASQSTAINLTDLAHVERMVPVLGTLTVRRDGHDFVLAHLLYLEANRPVETQGPSEPLTAVAGRESTATVGLRNWSPKETMLHLGAQPPTGWTARPDPAEVTVKPLTDGSTAVHVTPPADAPGGSYQVECTANYLTDPRAAVIAYLQVNVLRPLVPLFEGVQTWPQPPADQQAVYRQTAKLAIYAAKEETIKVDLQNVRVTIYSDTLSYVLRGLDLDPLEQGAIPVDEAKTIEHVAPETGAYYLELRPGSGSAKVAVENRPFATVATRGDAVHLFCSPITWCFFVPEGSTGFRLGAQDGGPDETARFVITSPAGRVALDVDGNYAGTTMPITVRPDEAGKVWSLRCVPRQDVTFWLEGGVRPYLSTSPERVLVEAGDP